MSYNLIALLLSFVLFLLYGGIYIFKYGVPNSFSATFYRIKHPYLFSILLVAVAALIIVPWLEYSTNCEFLAFFAVVSLFFVAASPNFKEDLVGKVHYGSAIILFITALLWEVLNGGIFFPFIIFSLVAISFRKHWLFWLEAGLIAEVHLSLIKKLLI